MSAQAVRFEHDPKLASLGENDGASTIGNVCREFGLTVRTLHFYENRGLISPQRHGSVRTYHPSDRARLALILKGKKLGFTLAEIRQMLAVEEGREPPPFVSHQPGEMRRADQAAGATKMRHRDGAE